MAKKSEVVRCYKAKDGIVFDTWREAQAHNIALGRDAKIKDFVNDIIEGGDTDIFPKSIPDAKVLLEQTIKAWEFRTQVGRS